MATFEVKRRTFVAKKMVAGSEERAKANRDPLTSEYYPGYRYLLYCYSADGSVAWTQQFATKLKAEATMNGLILAAT